MKIHLVDVNKMQVFVKKKGDSEPASPIEQLTIGQITYDNKGGLQYENPQYIEAELYIRRQPRKQKEVRAILLGYSRPSTIKRIRKRGIEKAKLMDHTSYEWSQWWKKSTRKPKRWK